MSSGLDCVECGGYISLERPSKHGLCRTCEDIQRREREGFPASYDDDRYLTRDGNDDLVYE
jgi:hypothetical protein